MVIAFKKLQTTKSPEGGGKRREGLSIKGHKRKNLLTINTGSI